MDTAVHFPIQPLQPGAYSALDASALHQRPSGVGQPVPAIIGDCKGGTPNAAQYFTDPQAMRNILRSGPAYDAARLALKSCPRVAVVRGGAPVASSSALAGTGGTAVTLTALDAGTWTNGIKRIVEANNKVTISFTDPVTGVVYKEVFDMGAGATAAQIVAAINGKNPTINGSRFVTAAAGAGTAPLTVAASAALAGGADAGAFQAGDWTACLTVLESEDVSIVVAATSDNTVHALVDAHCTALSTPSARRERTQLFGGAWGETDAATIARAAALRGARSKIVFPGIVDLNDAGVATNYDPFLFAALTAGMHCGLADPATSLVHADVPVLDVERRLSTVAGSSVDLLLAAGVSPAVPKPGGGIWFVEDLSTYILDDIFRDFIKIRSADESARRLRTRLEGNFTGGKTVAGTPTEIRQDAMSELDDQVVAQLIQGHLPVTVAQDPNRRSQMIVTAPVQLIDTQKFILITLALQPAAVQTA